MRAPILAFFYILMIWITAIGYAQTKDSQKLITGKWKVVDIDMDGKTLKDLEKDTGGDDRKMAREITQMILEFNKDGQFIASIPSEKNVLGSWSLSADGKQIITREKNGTEVVIEIYSLSKSQLVIGKKEGNGITRLILAPVK